MRFSQTAQLKGQNGKTGGREHRDVGRGLSILSFLSVRSEGKGILLGKAEMGRRHSLSEISTRSVRPSGK